MDPKFEVRFAGTTLSIYDDRASLTTRGIMGGTKDMYYCDIKAIEFRNASFAKSGFIDFYLVGNTFFGIENRFVFQVGKSELMEKVNDYVQKRWKESKGSSAVSVSVPEEIRKFKELLDDGIITIEEFEAKKKQLLSS